MSGKLGRFGIAGLITAGILLVGLLFGWNGVFEDLKSEKICVIQYPWTGTLTAHTTPGMKKQLFGSLAYYPKSRQVWQGVWRGENGKDQVDEQAAKRASAPAPIRFNDSGTALIYSTARWAFPRNQENILDLHQEYAGDWEAIETELVNVAIAKAIFNAGPLMSSKESYSERRIELQARITDIVNNGLYATTSEEIMEYDSVSGDSTEITLVTPILDAKSPNGIKRTEPSELARFGISIDNFAMNKIRYDDDTLDQIKKQRDAKMKIQTAKAQALESEQLAIKAEADGRRDYEQARWAQKKLEATAVTLAEQEKAVATTNAERARDVAALDREAAAHEKAANILRGQGEAERKKLVMQADGALAQKLETYERVNTIWANAVGTYKGNLVPTTVMGSSGEGSSTNAIYDFMSILTAQAAQNIKVDPDPGSNK